MAICLYPIKDAKFGVAWDKREEASFRCFLFKKTIKK